jgi:3'-phosphoadenosine 5'-phosphosulfate (PAPS) 3'-phosphatase
MQGICWLTDPLDGTAEFLHTSTAFCSVVSCVAGGEPMAAAVYHSYAGQLFSAAARQGASLDGRAMRVSETKELSEALFVASFTASSPERARLFAEWLEVVKPGVGGYRMLGSSALCAASVAAGRIDIYASTPEPAARCHLSPALNSGRSPGRRLPTSCSCGRRVVWWLPRMVVPPTCSASTSTPPPRPSWINTSR